MPLLRQCTPALAAALATGEPLDKADLFKFVLADGTTTYYWTSWSSDLTVDGQLYSSKAPWLSRSRWGLVNTMEVANVVVFMRALNDGFDGGANIKTQIHNGLFDGATYFLSRAYMPAGTNDTATLGTIDISGGVTAPATIIGTRAEITCKGKNNLLDQFAPRNVVQTTCLHAFCDVGCTLNRATFTAPYTVGSSGLTAQFIPWSGAPPAGYAGYTQGTLTMTSGDASGQSRTIAKADATGLTLVYPLYETPAGGDTFTAFKGCDKTKDNGSGQSCTDYANTQNFRAFPFVPPPNSAI